MELFDELASFEIDFQIFTYTKILSYFPNLLKLDIEEFSALKTYGKELLASWEEDLLELYKKHYNADTFDKLFHQIQPWFQAQLGSKFEMRTKEVWQILMVLWIYLLVITYRGSKFENFLIRSVEQVAQKVNTLDLGTDNSISSEMNNL